jgi:hypothetical protein
MARATLVIPTGAATFQAALEGLVRVNELLIKQHKLPDIYCGLIRYEREDQEVWRTAQEVARSGFGDCEDLACYLAAQLRVTGVDPGAAPPVRPSSSGYHALVTRSDGTTEDPSAKLGMNGPMAITRTRFVKDLRTGEIGVFEDDDDELAYDELGDERCSLGNDPLATADISWEVERSPSGGWRGIIRVPLKSGRAMFVKGPSVADPKQAAPAGVSLAAKLLNNKYADALIPGQAKMALAIARSATAKKIAKRIFG